MDELAGLISQSTDPEEVFELLDLLGQGSYGSVSKALHKQTGELYAIKILPATSGVEISSIKKQISILKDCNDDHIVKYYGSYFKDNHLWIVMEYCIAGSVADIMLITKKKFNQFEIASILQSALKGLNYIHSRKKIHRDIKAGNILLDQKGNAKLADFGVSASAAQTNARFRTHIGSPFWMSPEILKYSEYDYKTDIWSLGITAIQLAEGQAPNSHMKPFMAIFMIKSNPVQSLKQPSLWSLQFNDFVKKCLQMNPNNRPQAKQLLQHPFIKKYSKGQRLLSQLVLSSMAQIEEYRMNQSHNSSFAQIIVDDGREQTKTVVNKQTIKNQQQQPNQLQSSMIILQSHRSHSYTDSIVQADNSMIEYKDPTSSNKGMNILSTYINDMKQRQQIIPLKCAEVLIKNLNNYDEQLNQILNKIFQEYKSKVQNDLKSLYQLRQKNKNLNINIEYNCRIDGCSNLKEFISEKIQILNPLKQCKQNKGISNLLINSRQKSQDETGPTSKLILAKHNQSTQQRESEFLQKIGDDRKQSKSFLIPHYNNIGQSNMSKFKKTFNFQLNDNCNGSDSGCKASQFQVTVQKTIPNSHNSSRIVLKGAGQFRAVTQSQINEFKQPQILEYLQKKYINSNIKSQITHTKSNCNYIYSSNKMSSSKPFDRLTSTQQSKSKSKNKSTKQIKGRKNKKLS